MSRFRVDDFYQQAAPFLPNSSQALLPVGINQDIGHFNLFNIDELMTRFKKEPTYVPYQRWAYYKISLVKGRNRAEYADKVITVEHNALLFTTPKIPYAWHPLDLEQQGYFCIFTADFMGQAKSGVVLDELPLFRPGGHPLFQVSDQQAEELRVLFEKMQQELSSTYLYKYDLLRAYVVELIHYGQKLQPLTAYPNQSTAAARVSSLFIELLARQFPITTPQQQVSLRTAKDYAERLSVHTNHLNKVLKEKTGQTTTEHISSRLITEATILLTQTDWSIADIAYCLGFDQLSHFSKFVKQHTRSSPVAIRHQTGGGSSHRSNGLVATASEITP